MPQEQFDQIALILVHVCESYWPWYACPVFSTQCTYTYYWKLNITTTNSDTVVDITRVSV